VLAADTAPAKPLPDLVAEGLRALFVGINPGLLSARVGHHFANPANGFWRLMHESGLTEERLTPDRDHELLREGLGLTNLVDRETPGVAQLTGDDLARGRENLTRIIARIRPGAVVFVGVTGYRAFARRASGPVHCGAQSERIHGARVFVVPNPSGRNAHFTYPQMLEHFRAVARALRGGEKSGSPGGPALASALEVPGHSE
jgi:TDG/mug DNA glycosylase family protein